MEIELKLLVAPERLADVATHPAVRAVRHGPVRTEVLRTLYYDTPSRDLARAGIALRVRRSGAHWVQTLKARGQSIGGLYERLELEWPLADAALDMARLDETPYAEFFACLGEPLCPVFETEFTRHAIDLRFPDGTTAELALDDGVVRAGAASGRISEIEIELRQGARDRLFDLAVALSRTLPLRFGDRSKAERGDALATGRVRAPQPAARIELDASMTAAQALRRIALAAIAHMHANEAGVLEVDDDGAYRAQLRAGLHRLRTCLGLYGRVVQRSRFTAARRALRAFDSALWRTHCWDIYLCRSLPALAEPLRVRAQNERDRQHEQVRTLIGDTAYARLQLELARDCMGEPQGALNEGRGDAALPLGEWAQALLDQGARHLRAAIGAGGTEGRQWAYARRQLDLAACFASLFPGERHTLYMGRLAGLCESLEALHHCALADRLTRAVSSATEPARLDTRTVTQRDEALAGVSARWREFDSVVPFWR